MNWKYKQHKGVYIHSMLVGYEHKRCTYKNLCVIKISKLDTKIYNLTIC